MRYKLREVRLNIPMTQQELADKLGIARTTYTNIELGKKDPSLKVAFGIKRALDYENDDIFLITKCQKGTI